MWNKQNAIQASMSRSITAISIKITPFILCRWIMHSCRCKTKPLSSLARVASAILLLSLLSLSLHFLKYFSVGVTRSLLLCFYLSFVMSHFFLRFPEPTVPPMQGVQQLLPSAFTIAVVGFAVAVSMAKIFAKKHNYEVDSNQVWSLI